MKATLYIPVGLPGCGKSTYAQDMIGRGLLTDEAIVSPDYFRKVLTGRTADQSANAAVFRICHIVAANRLSRGLDVFFDATNLRSETRRPLVEIASKYGADIVTIVLNSRPNRNGTADRVASGLCVPDHAMSRMADEMELDDLPGTVWKR